MATYYGENSIIKQDKSGLNFGPNFAAKLHRGGEEEEKKAINTPSPPWPPIFAAPMHIRGSNEAIKRATWVVISRHNIIKNGPYPASFLYFCLFNTQLFNINVKPCRWLDLNCGPLVSEATALPTDPQPLPLYYNIITSNTRRYSIEQKLCTLYWSWRHKQILL